MLTDDLLKGLAEAGADVDAARSALDEMGRRMGTASPRLGYPTLLTPADGKIIELRLATRRHLVDAANYASERYLARRVDRGCLIAALYSAAMLAPQLDDAQVVSDVYGVAS